MSKLKEVKEPLIPEGHWSKLRDSNIVNPKKKKLTQNHLKYIKAIEDNIICLGIGPPGVAKSSLACKVAADLFTQGKIKRIIITRPIVETSSKPNGSLGFLPGSASEKMENYISQAKSYLKEYLPNFDKLLKDEIIQVIPLEVMRGRSFEDSFILAEEMQGASAIQIRMLLTRLSEGSKLVITADLEQCDLSSGISPLSEIIDKIMYPPKHPKIEVIYFKRSDCLRPMIVQFIDERLGKDYWIDREKNTEEVPEYGRTKFK